jgi:hypothetical protein
MEECLISRCLPFVLTSPCAACSCTSWSSCSRGLCSASEAGRMWDTSCHWLVSCRSLPHSRGTDFSLLRASRSRSRSRWCIAKPSRYVGSGNGRWRPGDGGLWQPVAATITDKAAHATVKHALETNGARQAFAKEGDACGGRASSGEKRANLWLGFLRFRLILTKLGDKRGVVHGQDLRRMRLDETSLL